MITLKLKLLATLKKCLNLSNPFNHLFIKAYFQSIGAYIPPESHYTDYHIERKNIERGVKPQMTQANGQCISLRHVLQKFLELLDTFSSTMQYMQKI